MSTRKFLSLYFFVLYYKKNIKHFFRIDIQLYQHSWKLGKLEIVCPTRVDMTVYQHGKCFIFVKYSGVKKWQQYIKYEVSQEYVLFYHKNHAKTSSTFEY
jgi:hypothetical protein